VTTLSHFFFFFPFNNTLVNIDQGHLCTSSSSSTYLATCFENLPLELLRKRGVLVLVIGLGPCYQGYKGNHMDQATQHLCSTGFA